MPVPGPNNRYHTDGPRKNLVPMPHDPTLIVKHGDDIECHLAERILNTIPSYATFWATYIGNDGRMNSLPMPQASPTAYANRETLWQCLYTLFESLALCWQLETGLASGSASETLPTTPGI